MKSVFHLIFPEYKLSIAVLLFFKQLVLWTCLFVLPGSATKASFSEVWVVLLFCIPEPLLWLLYFINLLFSELENLECIIFSVFLNCSCLFVLHITSCSTSILANSLYSAASNQLLLTTHCKISLQIADLCTGLIQGIVGSLILVPSTDRFTEKKF